ncbi:MAG TPA: SDR family oxidoreductase [Chitinophagaceae bacterium]|nr:SDR family oxidoreductase [Chitinophagaceae bacterium]
MNFKDRTVVITGAAKGIGAACKREFLAAGANTALIDIAFPDGRPQEDNILYLHCDVANGRQVRTAMDKIYDKFGRIDFLINNAGIQRYGTVTETPVEQWDQVMNVNLKSIFLCSKYAIPYMRKGGKGVIVNMASVQAFLSQKNVAAYTTTKSAILGLTRSIAVDYSPAIRCVAVCPGSVDTTMLQETIASSPDPEAAMAECVDMHLMKRIGKPDEVAAMVAFLCGDKAGFITGQAVRIDGGIGISIPGSKTE